MMCLIKYNKNYYFKNISNFGVFNLLEKNNVIVYFLF